MVGWGWLGGGRGGVHNIMRGACRGGEGGGVALLANDGGSSFEFDRMSGAWRDGDAVMVERGERGEWVQKRQPTPKACFFLFAQTRRGLVSLA